jgi:uncharacterized membrane protein YgaE (UPF0421/DUF939 family)
MFSFAAKSLGRRFIARKFSDVASKPVENVTKSTGSTLIERLSSFFVGCGVGFAMNFYLVHEELRASNDRFAKTLESIEKRLK